MNQSKIYEQVIKIQEFISQHPQVILLERQGQTLFPVYGSPECPTAYTCYLRNADNKQIIVKWHDDIDPIPLFTDAVKDLESR